MDSLEIMRTWRINVWLNLKLQLDILVENARTEISLVSRTIWQHICMTKDIACFISFCTHMTACVHAYIKHYCTTVYCSKLQRNTLHSLRQ